MTPPTPAQVEALIEKLKKAPSSITIGHAIEDEIDPLLYEAVEVLAALRDENAAYKEVVEDKRRIAREIEVIMFGKDAAPQPALCDIQASVRKLVNENAALRKELDDIDAMCRAALAAVKEGLT